MGFFSSLFRSRDAPQNRTAGSGYTFYFGGYTSGKTVTEDGGKEKAIGRPLYLLLHDEPNPEMSSFVFRETLMPNKMTVDRDERGQLYYSYRRSNDEAVRSKDQTVILRPLDVLHIPGLGFDRLVGYTLFRYGDGRRGGLQ